MNMLHKHIFEYTSANDKRKLGNKTQKKLFVDLRQNVNCLFLFVNEFFFYFT